MRRVLLLFVAAIGCRATFAGGQPVATPREPIQLTRFDNRVAGFSEYSGYTDEARIVVRDTAAWQRAWSTLNAGQFPQPPLPPVDFRREAVVLAAMGARPSGGYRISLTDAQRAADTIDVAVRTTSPGRGCLVPSVYTRPVDVAKIPARFREVRFRRLDSVVTCNDVAQRGEDTVPRSHILPGFGLHVGTPQKASIALGIVLGEDWQKNGRDHSRNVALFAEPGLGAGRASVAYVNHGYGSFGSGIGVAATVLRTWKEPWQLEANQTYVGGEIIWWPVLFTGPRIGLMKRVAGPDVSAKRWFFTLDFGIGL